MCDPLFNTVNDLVILALSHTVSKLLDTSGFPHKHFLHMTQTSD